MQWHRERIAEEEQELKNFIKQHYKDQQVKMRNKLRRHKARKEKKELASMNEEQKQAYLDHKFNKKEA